MNEITANSAVTACHPSSSAAASNAAMTHQEATRALRLA